MPKRTELDLRRLIVDSSTVGYILAVSGKEAGSLWSRLRIGRFEADNNAEYGTMHHNPLCLKNKRQGTHPRDNGEQGPNFQSLHVKPN